MFNPHHITGADDDPIRPAFFTKQQWEALKRFCGLSHRQAQIAGLKMQGKHEKEIEAILRIGKSVLRTHLYKSMTRLGAGSPREIPHRVFEAFLQMENPPPRQK
jgi:DNA-binding NarL/FixJ family response regulator